MKRTLSNPIFLLAVLLAAINQTLEKGFGIFLPVIHSYLDDLLCLPIVLTLGLAVYRYFWPNYRLTHSHTLPVLVVYSVYFEWYLPKGCLLVTSDIFDLIAYIIGWAIFNYSINEKKSVSLNV
ncbi:MAG: hypothetical protein K9J17_05940 [Flavobacteriales bacterium]|nr:hypothetical protein [Flavobacteriales bacterium]